MPRTIESFNGDTKEITAYAFTHDLGLVFSDGAGEMTIYGAEMLKVQENYSVSAPLRFAEAISTKETTGFTRDEYRRLAWVMFIQHPNVFRRRLEDLYPENLLWQIMDGEVEETTTNSEAVAAASLVEMNTWASPDLWVLA